MWNGHATQRATVLLVLVAAIGLLAAIVVFGLTEHRANSKMDAARAKQHRAERAIEQMNAEQNGPKHKEYKELETTYKQDSDALRARTKAKTRLLASAQILKGQEQDLALQVNALVRVPALIGLPDYEAAQTLDGLGLRAEWGSKLSAVTFTGSCADFARADADEVLRMAPAPGSRVEAGTTVYLGSYDPFGRSWEDAEERCAGD